MVFFFHVSVVKTEKERVEYNTGKTVGSVVSDVPHLPRKMPLWGLAVIFDVLI